MSNDKHIHVKVSVITVVRNAVDKIESTVKSVFAQDYDNVEYIVIDGCSTDGTVEVIGRYRDRLAAFVSEKDDGIYDALNKGVMMATGEWIGIMNAGDVFASDDVLSKVFGEGQSLDGVGVVYGDAIAVDEVVERHCKASEVVSDLENGPCYRHGASFVRRDTHRKYLFDLSKKPLIGFALDYEQIFRMYKGGVVFKKAPCAVVKYELRGASTVSPFKATYYNYLITHDMKCGVLMKFVLVWLTLWRGGLIVARRICASFWRRLSTLLFDASDVACYFASWIVIKMAIAVALAVQRREADGHKRVVVFANQAIGDTIIKLPFFFELRKRFPAENYRITVFLSPTMASAFAHLGCFDEVIPESVSPCKHVFFWVFGRTGFAARSLRWALCNKAEVFIACDRYRDAGIDFAHCLSRPAVSLAYDTSLISYIFPATARLQRKFYDKRYSFLQKPSFGRHQIDDMFNFLSFAYGKIVRPQPIDGDMLAPLLDFSFWESSCLHDTEYSVLVPGAGAPYRRWPTERFSEIAKRVGGMFVIVGTKSEACLAAEIATVEGVNVVDMCGKTNIRQLLGIVSKAKIVVANETGTANCAAVLGVKTVCILGGGDFGSFFPNRHYSNAISVFHKDDCFYCGWRCEKKTLCDASIAPCISSVTVDDVLDAICN